MSLDISVSKDGEELAGINWLRNPFGLEQWAERNVGDKVSNFGITLYDVCNNWAYDEAKNVDRKLFKDIVDLYWEEIRRLERGYFFFNFREFEVMVAQHYNLFPKEDLPCVINPEILGSIWKGDLYGIPQEYFCNDNIFHLGTHFHLVAYKLWFKVLVDLAELLQDPETEFYCSN